MRRIAIEYPDRSQMRFVDLGDPPPLKPTEILIATRYTGITNGTERHALLAEHGWTHFPGRHGYQNVGQVAAVGREVKVFKKGDWVYCGLYIGHRGWIVADVGDAPAHAPGASLILRLPDAMDHSLAALFGVAGVALRGVRRARVAAAQNVWVAGQGLIGLFCGQCAHALGARVTVADVRPDRLAIAAAAGAHRTIDMREAAAWDELQAAGPYDTIVEACGAERIFLDIHEHALLAPGGVILAIAVRSETTFHWATFHQREASIEVSCHFTLDDLRVLLHLVGEGRIQIAPVVSHRVPITEAPRIYETLRDRPGELLGVIFDWSE
ncbi:MAG: L-threonine 3-dehydrogenase [candidate division BRC1 bacterium ADurb.BinA292]|nr:MAG: L-threonine 3-dehydrogenase [candidate division BRC1 bacterium ADurb.BinA292]